METRKTIIPSSSQGGLVAGAREREYIFFKVKFNNFRNVSESISHEVLDR